MWTAWTQMATVDDLDTVDRVLIGSPDANAIKTPSWYMTNLTNRTFHEVIQTSLLDLPAVGYWSYITTITPYGTDEGGSLWPFQKTTNSLSKVEYIRYALNASTWGPWTSIDNSFSITYSALKALKTGNNLVKDATYHITYNNEKH